MDTVIIQPYLDSIGGSERVVLELAKRFNPVIYTMNYDRGKTFREFTEFDIRPIPRSMFETPLSLTAGLDKDRRVKLTAVAAARIFGFKISESYDVLSTHLPPSEWAIFKNPRMCWYCHGPNIGFRLNLPIYKIMLQERNIVEQLFFRGGAATYRSIGAEAIKKIESICTCSDLTSEKIRQSFGRSDVRVIYPGITPADFENSGYDRLFLVVSRFVPEKCLEISIEAFKKFNKGKNWKLVVAGHFFDNMRNANYLAQLKESANGHNISIEPNPTPVRIKTLYSSCHAFLFSSLDEDWGIVVLEAMASQKAVIAMNRGGPTISVLDGKTGFLVNNIEDMADKIRFLADHPDICEKMGREGRKRVLKNYTWEIFLDKMEKAFKETAKM